MIFILLMPAIYLQLTGIVRHRDLFDAPNKRAYYSNVLYPGDYRLQVTVPVKHSQSSARSCCQRAHHLLRCESKQRDLATLAIA